MTILKDTPVDEKIEYLYVVYGVVREAMPSVAYRRSGRQEFSELKMIKCPHCGERLTDVSRDVKVELFRLPSRKEIVYHFIKKCTRCKEVVGILMA